MKRSYALLLLFFVCAVCRSQDLIITTTDFKIQCKIVREDSVSLFYRIDNHPDHLEIRKTEVRAYYYNLLRQKKKSRSPSAAAAPTGTQAARTRVYLGATGGITFPLGEFASTDPNSTEAGLAQMGFLFRIGGVFKLAPSLGICASYNLQRNRINTEVFTLAAQQANPGIPLRTTATPWSAGGFFGGLHLEHTFKGTQVTLYAQGSLGWVRYRSPEVVTSVAIPGVFFNATMSSDDVNALGYLASCGLRLGMTENIAFHLGLGYFAGTAEFDYVVYSNNVGFSAVSGFTQPYSVLNTELGFVFSIGGKKK